MVLLQLIKHISVMYVWIFGFTSQHITTTSEFVSAGHQMNIYRCFNYEAHSRILIFGNKGRLSQTMRLYLQFT